MPFGGTTAIVTGGASGLGLAITEALVACGTNVAVFDVERDELDARVARLSADGVKYITGQVIPVNGGRKT